MLPRIPEPPIRQYIILAILTVVIAHETAAAIRVCTDSSDVRPAFLQTTRIIGRITDESSRPVSNAAVLIAGSERGTVSNLSGSFEIADAPLSGTLVIKHPDFEPRQMPIVKSANEYVIILKPRPQLSAARSKNQNRPSKKDTELSQGGESSSLMRPDRWPYFMGGYKAMNKFLANNLEYPDEALEAGVQGSVQVSFLLDEDGNVSSGRIIKSPGAELEEEALRLVRIMPKWTPAQKDGKPIAVWYTISILFDPEIEKLPLGVREDVPKLFSKRMRLEPLKAPFLLKDTFKKLFQRPSVDLSALQPPQTHFQFYGYGFVKRPVYVPLQLKLKPLP
ncbi:TonB family protein [Dyadobacter sp. CY261]|uniref:TonB family protein n=1 Tax=Dyadobacter sp. CY261 TaxID=2907203 RepID=UPI001F212D3D|nr:TonB family protein [Dyadobacter sp. CY261]MCF0069446.1 TonB family protein [Dyadobacter sp. CY261]